MEMNIDWFSGECVYCCEKKDDSEYYNGYYICSECITTDFMREGHTYDPNNINAYKEHMEDGNTCDLMGSSKHKPDRYLRYCIEGEFLCKIRYLEVWEYQEYGEYNDYNHNYIGGFFRIFCHVERNIRGKIIRDYVELQDLSDPWNYKTIYAIGGFSEGVGCELGELSELNRQSPYGVIDRIKKFPPYFKNYNPNMHSKYPSDIKHQIVEVIKCNSIENPIPYLPNEIIFKIFTDLIKCC